MTTLDESVVIRRPMAVDQIGPSTSRWTIRGPLGIEVTWTVEVTEARTNQLIRYETVTSPAAEVAANLHRLKELMETGRVTDGRHAVAGKFDHQP